MEKTEIYEMRAKKMAALSMARIVSWRHSFPMSDQDLTEEQIETYRETFKLFDEDNSGAIDGDELYSVMKKLGFRVSRAALRKMIQAVDTDGNGEIDFDEFLVMMKEVSNPRKEMKEAFQSFDVDGDGKISEEDLKAFIVKIDPDISESMLKSMMKVADKDQDGFVNFNEFRRVLKSQ